MVYGVVYIGGMYRIGSMRAVRNFCHIGKHNGMLVTLVTLVTPDKLDGEKDVVSISHKYAMI